MPSRRSVPGVFPEAPVLADDVEQVVGELEGDADLLAERGERTRPGTPRRRRTSPRSGRRWRSASRSCRRGRRGSARPGRRPAAAPTVSRIWPVTSRSKVCAWMRTASGPRSASRSEARAKRKSPVRMAMVLVQRVLALGRPAAHGGLVHDVVVVQRRQVGQLAHHGRLGHPRRRRVAELRGQQREQRPEPLAAGGHQVTGRLADERVLAADGVGQRRSTRARPSASEDTERLPRAARGRWCDAGVAIRRWASGMVP